MTTKARSQKEIRSALARHRAAVAAEALRLEGLGGTAWADGQMGRDVAFETEAALCAELRQPVVQYQARGCLDDGET